jgi:regulator of Ty1 transposition protein 109
LESSHLINSALLPLINQSVMPSSTGNGLQEKLTQALPAPFTCQTRYIHSPANPSDPLFSPLPGQEPEKTRCSNHFLTVGVDAASLPQSVATGHVVSFAIEVLIYSSKRVTTIFVSKLDSTSYLPRTRPSPIKTVVTNFLTWLADEERRKHPARKIVISLFARAQAQYLFPGSSEDDNKHVLDDRQLIKWWARVLDPIIPSTPSDVRYQGYLTVPGYAMAELRSFMPSQGGTRWIPGNPLLELATARGIPEHAPPRCLLPRFPDDPKARFISELDDEIGIIRDSEATASPSKHKSGRWKSVVNLDQFWEQMEFRQECSSGRAVGFLWLVISPGEGGEIGEHDAGTTDPSSQQSFISSATCSDPPTTTSNSARKTRKPLTGPIIPRLPKIKSAASSLSNMQVQLDAASGNGILVTKDSYDKAISALLHLDFSSLEIAILSTAKWIEEIKGITGLIRDFAGDVTGVAQAESTAVVASNAGSAVNDLGGMIRKKRKGERGQAEPTEPEPPLVNVLVGGLVRKKTKADRS